MLENFNELAESLIYERFIEPYFGTHCMLTKGELMDAFAGKESLFSFNTSVKLKTRKE